MAFGDRSQLSAKSSLDLSRRRVAAISFLANIAMDADPAATADEIRLDCLHNTHVLNDFKRKKEERQRWLQARLSQNERVGDQRRDRNGQEVQTQVPTASRKTAVGAAASMPPLAKKLTFSKTESTLFVDREETEEQEGAVVDHGDDPSPSAALDGDGLLHLDLSAATQLQAPSTTASKDQARSAPIFGLTQAPAGTGSAQTSSSAGSAKAGFSFDR